MLVYSISTIQEYLVMFLRRDSAKKNAWIGNDKVLCLMCVFISSDELNVYPNVSICVKWMWFCILYVKKCCLQNKFLITYYEKNISFVAGKSINFLHIKILLLTNWWTFFRIVESVDTVKGFDIIEFQLCAWTVLTECT